MDHWTPKNVDVTFTCATRSAINNKWELLNILTDFRVFEGSTSGQWIFDYTNDELWLSEENPNVFYGVVDTTGCMGLLTQLCRNAGSKAGFCAEHNFHLNALIAFDGT
jgi:ABC-type transporter MlaC component